MDDNDEIIDDLSTIPNEFKCPISLSVMRDPAITVDGFTFQRRSIQQWFNRNRTNPLTKQVLNSTNLIENRALRHVIEHHNERVRSIEAEATTNAQNLILNSYKSIGELFPEIMGDFGVSVDKLYDIFMNVSKLKVAAKNLASRYRQLKSATNNTEGTNDLSKQVNSVESILAEIPNYCQRIANLELDEINFVIVSIETIRLIDFKRFKKQSFRFEKLKGLRLKDLTLGQIKQKIKKQQSKSIPRENEIRFWKANEKFEVLFEHINNDVEGVTGTYVSRVRGVGKRLANMKVKISEVNLQAGDYFIVEHYKDEQYVFIDKIIKCDYCYQTKQFNNICKCKKASYCSAECCNKDAEYHYRVCSANQGNN